MCLPKCACVGYSINTSQDWEACQNEAMLLPDRMMYCRKLFFISLLLLRAEESLEKSSGVFQNDLPTKILLNLMQEFEFDEFVILTRNLFD